MRGIPSPTLKTSIHPVHFFLFRSLRLLRLQEQKKPAEPRGPIPIPFSCFLAAVSPALGVFSSEPRTSHLFSDEEGGAANLPHLLLHCTPTASLTGEEESHRDLEGQRRHWSTALSPPPASSGRGATTVGTIIIVGFLFIFQIRSVTREQQSHLDPAPSLQMPLRSASSSPDTPPAGPSLDRRHDDKSMATKPLVFPSTCRLRAYELRPAWFPLPPSPWVAYFVNSGTEANELAMLMARLYSVNLSMIALRNAYHGGSAGTIGLTALNTWKYPIPQAHDNVMQVPFTDGWGAKYQLFVKWKYVEAKISTHAIVLSDNTVGLQIFNFHQSGNAVSLCIILEQGTIRVQQISGVSMMTRVLRVIIVARTTSSALYTSKASDSDIHLTYSGLYLDETSESGTLCYIEKPSSSFSENDSVSCEDLKGVGSLSTTCILNSSLQLNRDLCISGRGNLEISPHVLIVCPIQGCSVTFNVSGDITIGLSAAIVAGSIAFEANSITLFHDAIINATSLGGAPPAQTSGTPSSYDGAGGGHGGRGASCLKSNKTLWGGDVYSWSTLSDPWSFGSKGGSASSDNQYGGDGGGRIMLKVNDTLHVDGSVTAEGGEGGLKGGGGSGGSIKVHALKLRGNGIISAAGGRGWGGGGGGRISLNCYSVQDITITAHGGHSIGCPENAGAAGTVFDKKLQSLKVSNDNFTTRTETPLLDFPTSSLWSNVFVENNAKVLVPLLWTRVQVRGQIRLLDGGSISFGLSDYPVSEFELVAEELLLSDSVIKVFGAFRMYVKMLLMWESKIQIDGGGNSDVGTSLLEARNLVVLRQNSVIYSNADLGVYGQGFLGLSGVGDAIKGRRLFLSLFYNISVGPGSLLQAPLGDGIGNSPATQSRCESQTCPMELIMPPDDCHVNSSLSFTLQICRVEDLMVSGIVRGSIVHIHRARTVIIESSGLISASELGCKEGIGKGKFLRYGAGGGAGHGGNGGSGFYNGTLIDGGKKYGDANLPCELGSGSVGSSELLEHVAGGGMIVMGSLKWPLSRLVMHGSLKADGQSHMRQISHNDTSIGGLGGGSGGTILLFLQALVLGKHSSLSIIGGNGGPIGGGGGGGGRIHFDWSNIATGDEYVQIAMVNGTIDASGGAGNYGGHHGEEGTITGTACPKGLYGTFCNECPVGTYKDVVGSDPSLCTPCRINFHPNRADFIYVRGGVTQPSCPYKCFSEKYKMPKCYTPFEELIYTFGGPWPFTFIVFFSLLLLALLLSVLRTKFVGPDFAYQAASTIQAHGPDPFPYLLSLAEVPGTSRAEETQSHVHRMYFMGPNTFREPWHLPYSPPDAIIRIVYEDAFNRFIDEINSVSAYEWWEGSVHSILAVLAYPCAWSWKQWRRRKKIHRLQEYVKSEYDHACLRSCRSRALYKGMKVGSTPDLMVAYIDFFLGGDERRLDVASTIQQRFPMCIIFGGDGSYMSPYYMHTDILLSNLIGEYVPTPIWNRLIAGFNAQLRTVRQGNIRSGLKPVISWTNSHANPQLECHGVKIELGWFQATASGYYQLGILVSVNDYCLHNMHRQILDASSPERPRKGIAVSRKTLMQLQQNNPPISHVNSRKRITGGVNGGIINEVTLRSLHYKRDFLFPFSLLLQNTRPIGLEEMLQLLISVMLLGDFVITLLMLLQFYWIYLGAFLAVLLILPLSLISPFPAGLNALFSRGLRRSSLARIYALWNASSLSNVAVAYFCGILFYGFSASEMSKGANTWNIRREDNIWWILLTVLLIVKWLQARLINWHIANVEIQDLSLFSDDPEEFWGA